MIRLLIIVLLLFVAHSWAQTSAPASPLTLNSSTPSSHDQWSLLFNGMTAIGTLLVALLAIFGQRIRNWIIRPSLALSVGDKSPCAEKKEQADESTSAAKVSYQLRLKISNSGRETARNCVVLCDEILREKAGGKEFYILKEFVPLQFYWTTKSQTADIMPKLPSFLNIAEISVPDESVSSTQGGTISSEGYYLQVQIEAEGVKGRFFRVDKGKIMVPILVHADNLQRSIKKYVEICWRGNTVADFTPDNFQIRILNEAEGMQIVGGA